MIADRLVSELAGPARPLLMLDVGPALGGLRFVELALFEWLGQAAATLEEDHEAAWASAASFRAAWRASQLEGLLPVSVGLPNAELATAPSGPLVAGSIAELAEGRQPDPVPGVGRQPGAGPARRRPGEVPDVASSWYDTLLAAYRHRLVWTAPAADGPLERVLCRLVADLEAERTAVGSVWERPGRDA